MIDSNNTLVSIVTINYYSENDILECYKSIYSKTGCRFELILVSNSPIESTFEASLKSQGIDAIIIETGENLGFAKACNIGAKKSSGELLFFLNPDTRFLNDVIDELIKCYNKYQSVGIIGPRTFNENGISIPSIKNQFSATYLFHLMFPPIRLFISSDKISGHTLPDQTQEVSVINGHAMFISTDLFKNLGGMEERFFMYWEENDLCKRVQKAKLSIVYCHDARCTHIGGTSTSKFFYDMEVVKHKSQLEFVKIHYSNLLLLNRIAGIIGYSWRALFSIFLLRVKKVKQFWTLFKWYLFSYK